jgi:hypothetical protein
MKQERYTGRMPITNPLGWITFVVVYVVIRVKRLVQHG